jgi:hypothetical protein
MRRGEKSLFSYPADLLFLRYANGGVVFSLSFSRLDERARAVTHVDVGDVVVLHTNVVPFPTSEHFFSRSPPPLVVAALF